MKISKYGYIRVKAVSPLMRVGDTSYNLENILKEINTAISEQVSVITFPELSLSGYSCEDLFHQSYLLDNVKAAFIDLVSKTKNSDIIISVGLPYQMPDGKLYNCSALVHKGIILGMTLKKYLPNYAEFYDMRFFSSGLKKSYSLEINGQRFVAGDQIYQIKDKAGNVLFTIGMEICEDLWSINPPSNDMTLCGADLILNLSASDEIIEKNNFRKKLLAVQSSKLNCAYVYVSSGPNESVKDCVFGGSSFIYENGTLLGEGDRFNLDKSSSIIADIDFDKIRKERRQNTTFGSSEPNSLYKIIEVTHSPETTELKRHYDKNPFVPSNGDKIIQDRCEEIFNILSTGLASQMKSSNLKKLVLGQSGGLDSSLVAIIATKALRKLNLPAKNLISVSMPGFGTSNRTKKQSFELAKSLGSTFHEIDIKPEVTQHLKDIKHPKNLFDITFENSQARARTKLLFNLSNKENGLHISGSSLSEIATGWASYGGDSISGYNLLGSVPKSLVKYLIKYESERNESLKDVLERILQTVISPELLPIKNKKIQSTEQSLGSYQVIDFIIFHQIRNGFSKEKIKFLLNHVYQSDENNKTVSNYYDRFYKNQFKRICVPGTIKIGIDLSPRASWRMPSNTKYDEGKNE